MKPKHLFLFTVIIFFLFTTGSVNAKIQDFWLGGTIGQFNPTEQVFKDIYGGGMQWRIEVGADILKWLSIWADTVHFSKTGQLSYTKEETSLKMSYLDMGIRFKIPLKNFIPYFGGGLGVSRFKEVNVIGEARDKEGSFLGEAGIMWKMNKLIYVNFRVLYTWCQIRPEITQVNIGGLDTSVGINFYFGKLFKKKKPKVWEW